MATNPPRFRFSLRTLFVVVTVFGVWLGWQLNWIKQRHRAAAGIGRTGTRGVSVPRAPGLLWVLGERGVYGFELHRDTPQEKVIELRLLFPEAAIHHLP